MASGGDTKMSEETFDNICNSCAKQNVTKAAIKYCVECKEYYCNVCVEMHSNFAGLAAHSLLDISTIQKTDQSTRLPSFPTERCSIHQGKVVDMYCGDHDTVGCYVCIAIDHKTCVDIHSIPDDIHQISTDTSFKYDNVCLRLHTIIENLQTTMKISVDDYPKKIDEMKQNALLAVTENRREIDAILDRLEKTSIHEIETHYNKLKSQLLVANEKLESILNEFIGMELKLKQAKGNISQAFVCGKLVESALRTKQDEDIYDNLQTFVGDCILSYTADNRIVEYIQSLEALGKVQSPKYGPYTISGSQSFDIRTPSDQQACSSYGSCLFGNSDILITDNNNKKLKRINLTQMTVVDFICLPYGIHGVCNVNNKEVAVACLDEQMIQFVSIGETMTKLGQLKLNHKCNYVAYMDNKLYITDGNKHGLLYIYTMAGKLIHCVSADMFGEKLFATSVQLTLDTTLGNIFVTTKSEIVCLDKKGNHIKSITCTDSNIAGADGVVLDGKGNIFVAGRKSNNIIQLGYDGTKRGIVVKRENGIKRPMSLCFKSDVCQLYVCMKDSNKMMVFDLDL